MFSKRWIGLVYILLSILIIFGFTAGYIYTSSKLLNDNISNDLEIYEATKEDDDDHINNDTKDVISNETDATKILEVRNVYSICGHQIISRDTIPEDIKELNEEQFRLAYSDYKIEYYNDNEIIISKVLNDKCPNHYIIKEFDGKVAVFYQQPIDGTFLRELTNVSTISLKKTDQQKLSEGIVVDSNEKLAEILEDLSS